MGIIQDSEKVLALLAQTSHGISTRGEEIASRCGLTPGEVNEASEILENRGLIARHQVLGTAPFDFLDAYITAEGRLSWEQAQINPADKEFEAIRLEDTQKTLLRSMVEAFRRVQPSQRQKFVVAGLSGGDLLHHPGFNGNIPVYAGDVEALADEVLVRSTRGSNSSALVDITPRGFEYESYLVRSSGEAIEQIDKEVQHYLDRESFAQRHPVAYDRMRQATRRLWSTSAEEEVTTVGHLCREAVQAFASSLVERFAPDNVDEDVKHDVARVRAVIDKMQPTIGKTTVRNLDALSTYWSRNSDAIQRLEHGGQREGEPLGWEDARATVFQSLFLMSEISRALNW